MSETAEEVLGGVRDVVAVHSAKGGVGKSTVAANLAVTLARFGLQVGLLDADVHGPSIAHMFGSDEYPAPAPDGARVLPLERHGVRFLSLANLSARVDERVFNSLNLRRFADIVEGRDRTVG